MELYYLAKNCFAETFVAIVVMIFLCIAGIIYLRVHPVRYLTGVLYFIAFFLMSFLFGFLTVRDTVISDAEACSSYETETWTYVIK